MDVELVNNNNFINPNVYIYLGCNCSKALRRVKMLLSGMEGMKNMLINNTEKVPTGGIFKPRIPKPCIFDSECPVAGCPFRHCTSHDRVHGIKGCKTDRKVTISDLFLGSSSESETEINSKIQSDADFKVIDLEESSTDEMGDFFRVKIRPADPCRVTKPLQYREQTTQYLETDFPLVLQPQLLPSDHDIVQSKSKNLKNKSQKLKDKKTKKPKKQKNKA